MACTSATGMSKATNGTSASASPASASPASSTSSSASSASIRAPASCVGASRASHCAGSGAASRRPDQGSVMASVAGRQAPVEGSQRWFLSQVLLRQVAARSSGSSTLLPSVKRTAAR